MAATVSPGYVSTRTSTRYIPWYIWCSLAAVVCAVVGVHWDISWHRTIGRDSFWTPAHVCIYFCGVLAGLSSGWLILSTTFDPNAPLRDTSVRIWGFRGPLGAFVQAWGGLAMLTSAPFDNWWHDAYGLDVKILSPPHMVLAAGIISVQLGALMLTLGRMNRASGEERKRLDRLFLLIGGLQLVLFMVLEQELTFRSLMHKAYFYRVVATAAPVVLAGIARASDRRWAATEVAGIYTVLLALIGWILPLFPAEPKLGPVYYPVTHFTPPEFPLLLIVPAAALDLLWQRTRRWNPWAVAIASGALFVAVFAAVQWPFADFLMSPAARNWFFGTKYFGYYLRPGSPYALYQYYSTERGTALLTEVVLALSIAMVTTRAGLAWGNWMRSIRR